MERKKYLEMCQRASFKSHYSGAWWQTKWNPEELVDYHGNRFVPVDYRFGFIKGNAQHLAIIHDLDADAEYTVRLEEIESYEQTQDNPNSHAAGSPGNLRHQADQQRTERGPGT